MIENREKIYFCSLGGLASFLTMLFAVLLLKGYAAQGPGAAMTAFETLSFCILGGVIASLFFFAFVPESEEVKPIRTPSFFLGSLISFIVTLTTAALMEMFSAGVQIIFNTVLWETAIGSVSAVFGIAVFRFGFGTGDAETSH